MITRKRNKGTYNDKWTGNDSGGTFQKDYRRNNLRVNCAEWRGGPDNDNYFSGYWGASDYQGVLF